MKTNAHVGYEYNFKTNSILRDWTRPLQPFPLPIHFTFDYNLSSSEHAGLFNFPNFLHTQQTFPVKQ